MVHGHDLQPMTNGRAGNNAQAAPPPSSAGNSAGTSPLRSSAKSIAYAHARMPAMGGNRISHHCTCCTCNMSRGHTSRGMIWSVCGLNERRVVHAHAHEHMHMHADTHRCPFLQAATSIHCPDSATAGTTGCGASSHRRVEASQSTRSRVPAGS